MLLILTKEKEKELLAQYFYVFSDFKDSIRVLYYFQLRGSKIKKKL